MKTIGLIGGTGWISTAEYYKTINETVNLKLGRLNFAKCILYSFNHEEIDALNKKNDQRTVYNLMLDASNKLIAAGAEAILLCANTLHMYADKLEENISVPLIHIAAATANEINKKSLSKVGLLGTKHTMEKDFYKSKLKNAGIDVLVPDKDERDFIHNCIFNELLKGIFTDESKSRFIKIIKKLDSKGAEGIILGCTEIPLIICESDITIPLFNTTKIHSHAAVDFAVGG